MPGKVRAELFEQVFDRMGADDPVVLQGPTDGEDAAAATANGSRDRVTTDGGEIVVGLEDLALVTGDYPCAACYV